jgi:type IV pilus assembly protein PilV
MVAMLITVVGLLGLLQAVNLAMEHNLRNQLRDEAIFIGEDWMGSLKVRAFDQISGVSSAGFSDRQVRSKLRGGNVMFTVSRPCSSIPTNPVSAQLIVHVEWDYKGVTYEHEVRSVRTQ